jgi:hypothetical protein
VEDLDDIVDDGTRPLVVRVEIECFEVGRESKEGSWEVVFE